MVWLALIGGLFIGAIIGMFVMGLCVAARRNTND